LDRDFLFFFETDIECPALLITLISVSQNEVGSLLSTLVSLDCHLLPSSTLFGEIGRKNPETVSFSAPHTTRERSLDTEFLEPLPYISEEWTPRRPAVDPPYQFEI